MTFTSKKEALASAGEYKDKFYKEPPTLTIPGKGKFLRRAQLDDVYQVLFTCLITVTLFTFT